MPRRNYVTIRFYEELNDYLPPARRKRDFNVSLDAGTSVGDVIERTGIPHTEVDMVLVNGESVGFSRVLRPADRISVYPVFEAFDISSLTRLRPEPLRETRFAADPDLRKLARYLRLLGFDCLCSNAFNDEELAQPSSRGQKRILLTRDQDLLRHKHLTHAYLVRAEGGARQTREILTRFDLGGAARPLSRCTRCNGLMQPAGRKQVCGRVPASEVARGAEHALCTGCRRVPWPGKRREQLSRIAAALLKPGAGAPGEPA